MRRLRCTRFELAQRGTVEGNIGSDPAGAFEWAKAITDNNSRESAYGSIYSRLLQKGPERANAALDAANLPADLAAKIRENTKPAPGGGILTTPAVRAR